MENRIKSEFQVEKTKLDFGNIDKIDTQKFSKTIKSYATTKVSLSELDEWEEYFEKNKKEIINLETEIRDIDNKIDDHVFSIYNISNDDRNIIEETISEY